MGCKKTTIAANWRTIITIMFSAHYSLFPLYTWTQDHDPQRFYFYLLISPSYHEYCLWNYQDRVLPRKFRVSIKRRTKNSWSSVEQGKYDVRVEKINIEKWCHSLDWCRIVNMHMVHHRVPALALALSIVGTESNAFCISIAPFLPKRQTKMKTVFLIVFR